MTAPDTDAELREIEADQALPDTVEETSTACSREAILGALVTANRNVQRLLSALRAAAAPEVYEALCQAAQFMDAVKPDAVKEGWWSEHDSNVRKALSDAMQGLTAASAPTQAVGPAPQMPTREQLEKLKIPPKYGVAGLDDYDRGYNAALSKVIALFPTPPASEKGERT